MAVLVVDDIITRAAEAADMHDQFIKQSTWINWFNLEHQALYLMCARGGWALRNLQFFSFSAPTDLVSGAFLINHEVMAVVGFWESDLAGRFRQINYTNGLDGMKQFPGTNAVTGHPVEFWIGDLNGVATESLSIVPYPTPVSGNFFVAVLNGPIKVTLPTDTFVLPMGIEELIVLRMARRALIKEESDTTAIDKLIQIESTKLEEYVWNRNLASSPKVRNTDDKERGWGWSGEIRYPLASNWIWI